MNIVDDYTRECLAIEVDTSLPGLRVAQVLQRLVELRGLPKSITADNGPEFAGRALDAWAYQVGEAVVHQTRQPRGECIHRERQGKIPR